MADEAPAPQPGASIETHDLAFRDGDHTSLRDLNLRVEPREIFGLLGPLGSGKSDTLKILAGMTLAFQGSASVAGFDLATQGDKARASIGYMPGYIGAYDDLQVAGYLEFFARACGVPAEAIPGRISGLLERIDMTRRAGDFLSTLDNEERHRLAVVKTLVHQPPVLLFDDPAAGLPCAARIRLRKLIGELARSGGHTVLVCSNILTDLIGLCDRIGVMHGGRMITSGPAAAIAKRLTGARILEFEGVGAVETLIERLREHPAIDAVNTFAGNVLASLGGEIEDPSAVVREVAAKGVRIAAFREHQVDLDLLVGQLVRQERA